MKNSLLSQARPEVGLLTSFNTKMTSQDKALEGTTKDFTFAECQSYPVK